MRVATVVFGVVRGSVRMKEMVRLLFLRCVKVGEKNEGRKMKEWRDGLLVV
ncbi:hypothetical protein COLO4_07293 [Corchorus olitorius]|uniref:Uncharacterized protein n=1 Tax=Corchorus olitorius TaxID=93759 RepID=A0A1R3KK82_9ROSI|nr:hypothetical protein COLO4_07293 [Corchorus olitorius]